VIEQTLVLIKPDGVRRGLVGEILFRFERVGLKVVALKVLKVDRSFAEKHYTYEDIAVRHGEEVRERLLKYITEDPVVAMVLEGSSCVEVVRKLTGATEPREAAPGTIRGDHCHHSYYHCSVPGKAVHNIIHASATPEEAVKEVALWFSPEEFVSYRRSDEDEHRMA